jgi:membrane protein required for colicin V production
MNWLDFLIIIPVAWFAYKGFSNGLILELASLAGLILGIYAALHFSDNVGGFLSSLFTINEKYLPVISFVVTFVGVVIIIYLIGWILSKIFDLVALGIVNKLFGAIFGIAKGIILVSVVFLVLAHFGGSKPVIPYKTREGSLFYNPVASIMPALFRNFLPSEPEDGSFDERILKKV